MESVGKRAWKKLEEDLATSKRMNKGVKTLPSGIRVASTSTSKKKRKSQAQVVAAIHLTLQNISFEGLNVIECKKWWQDTPETHTVKNSIRKA